MKPVSEAVYCNIFGKEYNLSFFKPKKDQCEMCTKYTLSRSKEHLQEEYDAHIERKLSCQQAKTDDKNWAVVTNNVAMATFDLQSVLQVPATDVSPLYYSRKLCMFNLTIYDMKPPNNGYCYCWMETDGKRGSNEVGTCLYRWLSSLPTTVEEAVLYSDTCGGQNRNQFTAALLLYVVQKTHLSVIHQKFLERGHTSMEVDSMHAAIECAKKFTPVYSALDWHCVFRAARRHHPYEVVPLHFSDFYDLKQLHRALFRNCGRCDDGSKLQWMKIKCLKFVKADQGVIHYRYSHDGDYKTINVFGRGRPPKMNTVTPVMAYKSQLLVTKSKYDDLQKLCHSGVIPYELHGWYKDLPTAPGNTW